VEHTHGTRRTGERGERRGTEHTRTQRNGERDTAQEGGTASGEQTTPEHRALGAVSTQSRELESAGSTAEPVLQIHRVLPSPRSAARNPSARLCAGEAQLTELRRGGDGQWQGGQLLTLLARLSRACLSFLLRARLPSSFPAP
jgi:hypothetical protein